MLCVMIVGFEGSAEQVARRREAVTALLTSLGGTPGGEEPGRAWLGVGTDRNLEARAIGAAELKGAGRLHAKAQGIARIVVNGRTLYRDGKPTGDLPGRVVSSA